MSVELSLKRIGIEVFEGLGSGMRKEVDEYKESFKQKKSMKIRSKCVRCWTSMKKCLRVYKVSFAIPLF